MTEQKKQKLSTIILTCFPFKKPLSDKRKSAIFTNFRHGKVFLCIYYEKLQKS